MSEAWAAVSPNEGILVATVSHTRRAAMVNWLVVEAGVLVTNDWTDTRIEEAWRNFALSGANPVRLAQVEVREKP